MCLLDKVDPNVVTTNKGPALEWKNAKIMIANPAKFKAVLLE